MTVRCCAAAIMSIAISALLNKESSTNIRLLVLK